MRYLVFLFTFLVGTLFGEDQVVRRAAFDIGSGQVKLQVADVDVKTNTIVQKIHAETAFVPLREELTKSLNGRLSDPIQDKYVEAIKGLMDKAAAFNPEVFYAVVTEPLRMAVNGGELAARIKKEAGV